MRAKLQGQHLEVRGEAQLVQRGGAHGRTDGAQLVDQRVAEGNVVGRGRIMAPIGNEQALQAQGRLQRLVVQIGSQVRALLLMRALQALIERV